jgi:hypothetical protein
MANLLQHEIERFGAVTVMDAMLLDYETKKPVMFLDTLKISSITAESEMKEIKGGKFADVLITYDFARTIGLEFQDALVSSESMKNLWGAKITDAATGFTIHQREYVTATTGGVLTLEFDIAEDTDGDPLMVTVYDNEGAEVDLDAATFGAKTVTEATAITSGDEYVVYYIAQAPAAAAGEWDAIQALISSETFPKTVTFVGKTFFINQKTGKKIEAEIEVPKLKLAANFTLGLEAEGDASVFDFSGMALIDGKEKELLKIKTIRYID